MSLLDIDNTINDIQPIFNSAIIKLIKNKKTDMICWLDWEVKDGFYEYNTFSKQLESVPYNFDPKQWFVYHLWNTQTLFISKHIGISEMMNLKVSTLRLHGHGDTINLSMLYLNI